MFRGGLLGDAVTQGVGVAVTPGRARLGRCRVRCLGRRAALSRHAGGSGKTGGDENM